MNGYADGQLAARTAQANTEIMIAIGSVYGTYGLGFVHGWNDFVRVNKKEKC